ncbi:4Fe-4S dicluster domain-containing protein [Enterovibrio sp. ZSDZ35]|uniref:4Fe-4S dicluster domain-containing protein n=1 Tax=Enterovibrio qingdaonensis TaxID=2899818 RepID=A0ABT5QJF1_9GAMM|nr:4Fe-4S dicluster domain-containing protein [Enterovibrio sp. ZSDZ35]MDD1781116.1 4Fe-4S dicluster domain-containing protein [Enterovibrio sp. ZSDZ35]
MREKDERYYHAQLNIQQCSRRGLFRGLWSGVSKPMKASATVVATRSAPRPPTAVEDALLVRLCNQCGECVAACPQHIIGLFSGLPELALDANGCNECGECQRACPTLALASSTTSTGAKAIASGMCIRQVGAECDDCSAACPHGAITLTPRGIEINADTCSGCAQCRIACSTNAIHMTMR